MGRKLVVLVLAVSACAWISCSDDRMPTAASKAAREGSWGSSLAGLTVARNGSHLLILASGDCYGSYADIDGPIPTGTFSLSGTFTQLIGASPGKIQYAATCSGSVSGDQMTILLSVPGLQQPVGPFQLTYGVTSTWPACEYP